MNIREKYRHLLIQQKVNTYLLLKAQQLLIWIHSIIKERTTTLMERSSNVSMVMNFGGVNGALMLEKSFRQLFVGHYLEECRVTVRFADVRSSLYGWSIIADVPYLTFRRMLRSGTFRLPNENLPVELTFTEERL